MNEIPQLASAMLAIAFAAVMLVAGQLYIENKIGEAYGHSSRANRVAVGSANLCL